VDDFVQVLQLCAFHCIQGAAKKWTPNFFAVFLATVWDFNIKFFPALFNETFYI